MSVCQPLPLTPGPFRPSWRELGAMPPFGPLYGLKVHVTAGLAQQKEISFNAGTHSELIRLTYADYERLVHPTPLTN